MNKADLEIFMNNVGKAITDLATHVGKINKRLDDLEENVKKLSKDNSQFDYIDDDISELRERIDELEGYTLPNRVAEIENIFFRLRDALEVR